MAVEPDRPAVPAVVASIRAGLATMFSLVIAIGAIAGLSGVASAHTELLQGSPGPAQRAGGTVDFVDLAFFEPINDATIEIESPSGQAIEGRMTVTDGQIVRYEMQPLTETGRYILSYTMTSADGDFTESAYFFTYHPDAVQPVRLGDADLPSNRNRNIGIAAGVVFVLSIIGLAMIMLSRLERTRAAAGERP